MGRNHVRSNLRNQKKKAAEIHIGQTASANTCTHTHTHANTHMLLLVGRNWALPAQRRRRMRRAAVPQEGLVRIRARRQPPAASPAEDALAVAVHGPDVRVGEAGVPVFPHRIGRQLWSLGDERWPFGGDGLLKHFFFGSLLHPPGRRICRRRSLQLLALDREPAAGAKTHGDAALERAEHERPLASILVILANDDLVAWSEGPAVRLLPRFLLVLFIQSFSASAAHLDQKGLGTALHIRDSIEHIL